MQHVDVSVVVEILEGVHHVVRGHVERVDRLERPRGAVRVQRVEARVGDDVAHEARGLESAERAEPALHGAALGAAALDLGYAGDPAAAQTAIDTAMNTVLSERSKLGGLQNRMEVTIEDLSNKYENISSSFGRIVDVDVASEMASYTKNQVLLQAGSSMLAQANAQPQNALALLGG